MSSADSDELRGRLRGLLVFEGQLPPFDPDGAPEHPAELFLEWLGHAIDHGVREPHAMVLSTVDGDGRPSSRVLLLKDVSDGRWEFATSRSSRKGRELERSPWAAINFHWPGTGRQVRLRGRVLDAGPEAAARDYLARPQTSRAASWIGRQSEELVDRAELDSVARQAEERVAADPDSVPEDWAVYQLIADEVEFWQADRDRRHLRLSFRLSGGRWRRQLLWP